MNIDRIMEELTLEEKASLIMGKNYWQTYNVDRLDVPSIRVADGPHGIRRQYDKKQTPIDMHESHPATCFPPASLSSCSFDRKLICQMGEAIAKEALVQNVDVVLGCAINIKRSPLCGRNFEYVSEDPYLSGEYAVNWINGVQSMGVGTSLKHFALNNQESLRMNINAVVDERALREIYLYPFERAIKKANPYTIMASYNHFESKTVTESKRLLTDILRNEWKYDGLVMSDWMAVNNRVNSVKAGCDLEMPNSGVSRVLEVIEAVKSGAIKMQELDACVRNVLKLIEKCVNNNNRQEIKSDNDIFIPSELMKSNNELAVKVASESFVLLKNEQNFLPFDCNDKQKIAVVGSFAVSPRYQGGGSSHICSTELSSFCDVLDNNKIEYEYASGYDIDDDKVKKSLIKQAIKVCQNKSKVILFVGLPDLYEYEGVDRKHLSLPKNQIELINAISQVNSNVVIVLNAGSAVQTDWDNGIKSMLYAGVMGQGGSAALYDVIFGKVNPSGRLTESFPERIETVPCYHNFANTTNSIYYSESIYVGYRYYNSALIPTSYPFGYGLSYSKFVYSNFNVVQKQIAKGQTVKVSVDVENKSAVDGKEVVQIYVTSNCKDTFYSKRVLKGFEKVEIKAGDKKTVCIEIPYDDFKHYDNNLGFVVTKGIYEVSVCKNSQEVIFVNSIFVDGEEIAEKKYPQCYAMPSGNNFSDNDFGAVYSKKLPAKDLIVKKVTPQTPLRLCRKKLVGKIILHFIKKKAKKSAKKMNSKAATNAFVATVLDFPIRVIVSQKGFDYKCAKQAARAFNGSFICGIRKFFKEKKRVEKLEKENLRGDK